MHGATAISLNQNRKRMLTNLRKDKLLYYMVIPGVAYFVLFHYVPMVFMTIAFQEYNIYKGMSASVWSGLNNFRELMTTYGFVDALRNTLIISLAKIVCGFPLPIIFAIALNEIREVYFKKTVQTVVCLPHFISWIVIQGLLYTFFASSGAINSVMKSLGIGERFINILTSKQYFRSVIVLSDIWKGFGYGSVLYIATITSIDQQLYEAATIDGAGKLKQMYHVTLPGLRSTILIMFILRLGNILNAGFDQIYAISNTMVTEVAEILDTFVYRMGIQRLDFSRSMAAGLFKSVVGLMIVLAANAIVRRLDPDSALM